MNYKVVKNEPTLEIEATDSEVFFEEFSKLQPGEYTVTILSDESRSARRCCRKLSNRTRDVINTVLEFIAILLMMSSIIPLWIIGCALI